MRPVPGGVRFRVRVQPRAARNEAAGLHGAALRVRLTAPPVEGAANEACLAFLAERLGVPRGCLTLVSGHASREKLIEALGVDEAALRRAFGL